MVKVHQGKFGNDKATFEVSQVMYGDLMGSRQEQAVIVASCTPQTAAHPGFENDLVYVYGIQNGQPALLATFAFGQPWNFVARATEPKRQDGLMLSDITRVSVGVRSISFEHMAGSARCCPTFYVTQTFRWTNGQFVLDGEQRRPWKENTEQSDALKGQPPAREAQPPAAAQPKLEVEERRSNVIPMKDGFEYRVIDYGVGRIQVRNQGTGPTLQKRLGDFTEQVFWVKFQITNKAENLIGSARYFPSLIDALRVADNWGNVYSLRYPNFTDIGGNWSGAELPIPGGGERKERYKPNESSWALRLIPVDQFVAQVKELRIYLANQLEYPKFYFKIEEPLSRQRDLLRSQADPDPSELPVKSVTESSRASVTKPKK